MSNYPASVKCFLVVWIPKEGEEFGEWYRPDTGEFQESFQGFGPGAMGYLKEPYWGNATHESLVSPEWKSLPAEEREKGTLAVLTPGGFWNIDHNASSGTSGWSRTGIAPNVTANPSIFINPPSGYHGWLRNGELVRC